VAGGDVPAGASLRDEPLASFLGQLADGTPAPAGGAAAAITAAIAAAIVGMVARIAARRPDGDGVARKLAEAADGYRETAVDLAERDANAYRHLVAARRQYGPGRSEIVAEALRRATDVPHELADVCRELLRLGEELVSRAPAVVASDVAVSVTLASAGLSAAVRTARANLRDLRDDDAFASATAEHLDELDVDGTALAHRILDRLGRSG
jgi:formiminotetrahydrofolate cyclodeaminase